MKYLKNILKRTPQNSPLWGAAQVQNSAGGYSFTVTGWTRLNRFLILGSEGGSYYATEAKLTRENAKAVEACILEDGLRVVKTIVEISDAGRAPKNDPALFALAMCAAYGDEATRKAAFQALPKVARIGTHLFHFAEYVDGMRGWGRGLRSAVGAWYSQKESIALANQVTKYVQRDGWSHRDLLRLAHVKTDDTARNALYKLVVDGWEDLPESEPEDEALRLMWATERLKRATSEAEAAQIVAEYRLPMEVVPSGLRGKKVWEAVLPHAGLTFLIRNLGNLSKSGILQEGAWNEIREVTNRLADANALKKARIHPIQVLSALCTYQSGHGARGGGEWKVVPQIVDALNVAFYRAFGNVAPTELRWVLGLDVSGSMGGGTIAGIPGLTPRLGSMAMAMVNYRVERDSQIVAFSDEMVPVRLSKTQSLEEAIHQTNQIPFGRTDCALPMLWAMKNRVEADVFVIYTDSETWYGDIHPVQALREYRQKMGVPAKLVVVGMVSNGFTIADPQDGGMMDVVGFDTSAPNIIGEFALGNV